MAVQLQLVFNKADEKRNKLAVLKSTIKQELEDNTQYQDLGEKIKEIRSKRKQIVESVLEANKKTAEEIDILKCDLESDKMMISDFALSDYIKGKLVELKDGAGNILVPVFSVRFVKK